MNKSMRRVHQRACHMEPSIHASYLPAPLIEDPEDPGPTMNISTCSLICYRSGAASHFVLKVDSMCSVFHHIVFMKK